MGVDYTAFVCWGQRVYGENGTSRGLADLFESNNSLLSKHNVGFVEYGSRQYGGDGGFILTYGDTYVEIDMRREAVAKPLPKDRDWDQVRAVMSIQDVLHELRKRGAKIQAEGETGWFVCGHVS